MPYLVRSPGEFFGYVSIIVIFFLLVLSWASSVVPDSVYWHMFVYCFVTMLTGAVRVFSQSGDSCKAAEAAVWVFNFVLHIATPPLSCCLYDIVPPLFHFRVVYIYNVNSCCTMDMQLHLVLQTVDDDRSQQSEQLSAALMQVLFWNYIILFMQLLSSLVPLWQYVVECHAVLKLQEWVTNPNVSKSHITDCWSHYDDICPEQFGHCWSLEQHADGTN